MITITCQLEHFRDSNVNQLYYIRIIQYILLNKFYDEYSRLHLALLSLNFKWNNWIKDMSSDKTRFIVLTGESNKFYGSEASQCNQVPLCKWMFKCTGKNCDFSLAVINIYIYIYKKILSLYWTLFIIYS